MARDGLRRPDHVQEAPTNPSPAGGFQGRGDTWEDTCEGILQSQRQAMATGSSSLLRVVTVIRRGSLHSVGCGFAKTFDARLRRTCPPAKAERFRAMASPRRHGAALQSAVDFTTCGSAPLTAPPPGPRPKSNGLRLFAACPLRLAWLRGEDGSMDVPTRPVSFLQGGREQPRPVRTNLVKSTTTEWLR